MSKFGTVWAALALSLAATAETNDWESTAVNSRNRAPERTYSMPLSDEGAALTDALEPDTPYKMSLNGRWKFSWAGSPDLRAKDFWRTDFDDSDWFGIDVPGCVEMQGFGSPQYVNVAYPFANKPPRILDRQTERPDYNPVSSYRRTFELPASWRGREVYLRFDGVYSAYYVWVNGQKVGYAEDSCLPSEFNITSFLNLQPSSPNLLCVEVYRWCDGSYLEDQDMFRCSGIFRDVTLWSMPKGGIWDFAVKTTPVNGYENWKLEVKIEGQDQQRMSASLYDADRKKVDDLQLLNLTFHLDLSPRLWSAEDPYLYTLVIRRGGDIRMKRIGFREVKIENHAILFNGRPIKFKGVNRHESHPETGKTVSLADMERDVRMMKRANVNTVRTAHYPDHRLWYDLCDRYGLYVCAEANVEGHEPGRGSGALGAQPTWCDSIVERNVRQVRFYRNHPSVFMWSMGNETGTGEGFRRAVAAVKALDPTRPTHWNFGNELADVDSTFYRPLDWLETRGQIGDGAREAVGRSHGKGRVLFMCEYAHAMGNALGNFREYWDVFHRHRSLAGGCVWDWADQAVWKDDGRGGRFLAYGGDWDDRPNDGPFCDNGLVGPMREPSAKLAEVTHVHRNLAVTRMADGTWELWNRFGFTPSDAFAGRWRVKADGRTVAEGNFSVPHVEPLDRKAFSILALEEAIGMTSAEAERFAEFEFSLKQPTRWADAGFVIARDQIALDGDWWQRRLMVQPPTSNLRPVFDGDRVVLRAGSTVAEFSRRTGTLARLEMDGRTILADTPAAGPRLTCMRAFTDNDCWLLKEKDDIRDSGLTQLNYHARPLKVGADEIICTVEVTGSRSAGWTHISTWRFSNDGSVFVRNEVTPHGTFPKALPRLGTSWTLHPDLERVEWYGRGPHENYIDRMSSAFVGFWSSSVAALSEPYTRPQDNGYRADVRHVSFLDADGRGVTFSADRPLFVQALHCTREDLDGARHRNGERRRNQPVPQRPEIYLNLDVEQLGLGNASCGPEPLPQYRFDIRPEVWNLTIRPHGDKK